MGDYLRDLVTKNIGTANVIEPRRLARFEPTQTKGAFESQIESPSTQSENFEEHIIKPISPTRPLRRREEMLSAKDEVKLNEKRLDEPIEQMLKVVTPTKTHAPETKQNDARVTITNAIKAKTAEKQKKPNSIIEHSLVQRLRKTPAETGELKMPPAKNFEKQSIEEHIPIIVKPRIGKVENRVEETTIHQTMIRLPGEQMSNQISERAKEVSETPIINVTIGRVEVRAVTSAAPSKVTQAKPQTLSLDEYLRKRQTGGEQ